MRDNPIVAVAPGKVVTVSYEARAGFYVKIAHVMDDNEDILVWTDYLHMKRWPLVNEGDYVGAGTLIGYEGNTGRSFGSHLHFEVNDGVYEPYAYVFPTFNPFYYDDKAEQDGYSLTSEYMSLYRTVSMVETDDTQKVVVTGEKLENKHPDLALVEDFNDLIQRQGETERKTMVSGELGWNESCETSKEYIEHLKREDIYDLHMAEAYFDYQKARSEGYLAVPNELYTALYGSICVKTDMPGALPPLTREELMYILENWLPTSGFSEDSYNWLMSTVFTPETIDKILEAQDTYGVSPVFMLAVALQEQSIGVHWLNSPKKNVGEPEQPLGGPRDYNIFSITGTINGGVKYKVQGEIRNWNKYTSYGDAFMQFSRLISEDYFSESRYTIATIGPKYCDAEWIRYITSHVFEIMEYYPGSWNGLPAQIILGIGNSADLLNNIKSCMEYYQAYGFTYKFGGRRVPAYRTMNADGTWGAPSIKTTDCSGYVSWVIYEWASANGYEDLKNSFSDSWSTVNFEQMAIEILAGNRSGINKYFQVIWKKNTPYTRDILLPCDIILYRESEIGHIAFLDENLQIYDAGRTGLASSPWGNYNTRASDRSYVLRLVRP